MYVYCRLHFDVDVVSDWLACFPVSAKKHVYDVFFVNGFATEVVQTLVPYLQYKGNGSVVDVNAVQSNTERYKFSLCGRIIVDFIHSGMMMMLCVILKAMLWWMHLTDDNCGFIFVVLFVLLYIWLGLWNIVERFYSTCWHLFNNSVRLLVLCLLENDGVLQIAREFGSSQLYEDFTIVQLQPLASRVAQIVASIPDKAQPRAPTSLSSQYPWSLIW